MTTAHEHPASSADVDGHEPPRWVDRAVLVYGPRKAGTTLIHNLLDGGDGLFVYPAELKLKYFVREPGQAVDPELYYSKSRICETASPRLSCARYRELWRRKLDRRRSRKLAECVRFDAWAACESSEGPRRVTAWCAKEVGGRTEAILRAWREMFPDGKILLVARDPRMITRAVLNDRRRKGRRLAMGEIVRETLDPMAVLTRQSMWLDEPRVFLISYEDLVADTPGTMAKVAEFLGTSYSAKLTFPSVLGDPVIVRTASQKRPEVFRSSASWRDGLTLREAFIVAVTRAAAPLLLGRRPNRAAPRKMLKRLMRKGS